MVTTTSTGCRGRAVTIVTVTVLALTLGRVGVAAAGQVRAHLDRAQMRVGEQAILAVEIEGTSNAPAPNLDRVDGFTVRYLGPSTQFSIVQGSVSQSVTHRYALLAERAGRFTIGPIDVQIDGRTHRADPVAIEVSSSATTATPTLPGRRAGAPDLSLVLELPRREVFVHERVPVSVTLYVGEVRVDDVMQPRLEGDAFSVEPYGTPAQSQVTVGGRRYQTVRFDTSIVPLRAGTLSIGPAVQNMSVLMQRRGTDPFFNRFFGATMFADAQPYVLRSNPETLTVRRLPEEGRPADFSGAVGRFDLEVAAKPGEVQVNDPVTVTMRISGSGNLAGIEPPHVGSSEFRSYPPQSLKAGEGTGTRVFEQVLIPTSAAVREIPAVRLSYFDPEAAAYRVVTRGPIPLVVRAGFTATGPSGGKTSDAAVASPERLGQDIVYIKDDPGRLRAAGVPFGAATVAASAILPLGMYLGVLTMVRRRERLHGDPRYARFVQAGHQVRRAIAVARKRAGAHEVEALYDDLARALREYLSAKLDVPPGAVDAHHVGERLGDTAAPVVRRVGEFFSLVDGVRYARAVDGDDGRAALALAESIVRDIERLRGLEARFEGGRRAAAVLLMIGLIGGGLFGGTGAAAVTVDEAAVHPRTSFFEANTQYKTGHYDEAIAGYEAVRAAGLESGALYYNLGNAYFKAGKVGRAVLSWERARQLLPRDPDVAANLRFARRQIVGGEAVSPPEPALWLRLVAPLAFWASTRELGMATALAYCALLLLATLRLLVPGRRQVLGRCAIVAGLVALAGATALGVRAGWDALRPLAVVVDGAEVPVRFEPSESGTVHFTLPAGAVVELLDARPGWEHVMRADGRRGWVEIAALEPR